MNESSEMRAVCLVSGGIDSTTLLWHLKRTIEADIIAVSFDYGQRHRVELRAAEEICRRGSIPHKIIELDTLGRHLGGSSQTDENIPVPEGHYADESMKTTVVPNRNMIMLSIATGIAIANKYNTVAYAAHAGDHAVYPDCRPVFAAAMRGALKVCDYTPVMLYTPFLHDPKNIVVAKGATIQAPLHLTHSCYKGYEDLLHCGKCGTCVERKEAFEMAGVDDPTKYIEDLSI